MLRFIFFTTLFASTFLSLCAQSLYMPRDVQHAYKNGTRSKDGRPAKNYWQNKGRYDITINVTPPDRTINGHEKITYINNSPDTLQNIVIKLIQNIHKPGALRYSNAGEDYLTSGVNINSFTINGHSVQWNDNLSNPTWQSVNLPAPLPPKDSIHITVDWHYEISQKPGREGRIDSTTFFLAYFYPRIAVYDDYNGWDKVSFTDQQEFYNDFNDYKLTVKAPKNFVVWATGTLQNPEEVLQTEIAKRLKASETAEATIHIASKEELASGKVTAQNAVNSWRFTASHITDVALAISDHYLWDAGSSIVDERSNRRASVQAAYSESAKDFRYAVEYGRHALNWFSHHFTGVPYPFPKMTVFQGGANMEYPMMVNDSSFPSLNAARRVENHEIAHTWFPFYMGINESRYAFMDEGWATVHEYMIGHSYQHPDSVIATFKKNRVSNWYNNNSPETDLPIITPSYESRGAYRANAYGKPALAYLALRDLLGHKLFMKCLQEYMHRWNGKHPLPWDFFYTFNQVSGKNLNWFWNNWFFSPNYMDLSVSDISKNGATYEVNIANLGGFAIPFDLEIRYEDGSSEKIHQTPALWGVNSKQATLKIAAKKAIKSVHLEGEIFMDATPENNFRSSTRGDLSSR